MTDNLELFSIGGMSGAGKNTVVAELAQRYQDVAIFPRTTTRMPRKTEVNGVDYFFVDKHAFFTLVIAGLEPHQETFYGIDVCLLKKFIEENCDKKILIIGGLCGLSLKPLFPSVKNIFLTADTSNLIKRMRRRGDDPKTIQKRAQWLPAQRQASDYFDIIIKNEENKLGQTVDTLAKTLNIGSFKQNTIAAI